MTSTMFHPTIPHLQIYWDNTSLSVLKTCPRKYFYEVVRGLRPKTISPPLAFGSALHDSFEAFDAAIAAGSPFQGALRGAVQKGWILSEKGFGDDTARTRITLLRAIVWYADQYQHDIFKTFVFPDGTPALELSFRFELPFNAPTDGIVIEEDGFNYGPAYIYCGHIDKLATYKGNIFVLERKHTKSSLSDSYFLRYTFSAQVNGYVYAGKVCLDTPVVGAVVDSTQIGVSFARFGRRPALRINESLDEWMRDTKHYVKMAEGFALEGFWPHNSESCSKYGGCPFREACSKGPQMREVVLQNDFKEQRWDPTIARNTDD